MEWIYLNSAKSQNDPHKIAAEILTAEKEREKCNERRDANRDALEKLKRKLPINLEIDALSPQKTQSALKEAEDLCVLLKKKD